MNNLDSAKEKISSGERLNFDEILALYEDNDLYIWRILRGASRSRRAAKKFSTQSTAT